MAMKPRRKAKAGDAHVRLYGWEMETPAFQTLDPDGRALLVEFRALYDGRRNRVHFSVREMMRRLGIGQRRAERARDALIERGWVVVTQAGAFHVKAKIATEYAITNEPLTNVDGAVAPKTYMRWQPPEKITVAVVHTHGSRHSYRGPSDLSKKRPNGSRGEYRKRKNTRSTVFTTATQIGIPVGTALDVTASDVPATRKAA